MWIRFSFAWLLYTLRIPIHMCTTYIGGLHTYSIQMTHFFSASCDHNSTDLSSTIMWENHVYYTWIIYAHCFLLTSGTCSRYSTTPTHFYLSVNKFDINSKSWLYNLWLNGSKLMCVLLKIYVYLIDPILYCTSPNDMKISSKIFSPNYFDSIIISINNLEFRCCCCCGSISMN